MLVTFVVDDIQWGDCGGVVKGDTITTQLEARYPIVLRYHGNQPTKLINQVLLTSMFYEIAGPVLEIKRIGIAQEFIVDCGVPVRIVTFSSTKVNVKDFVNGLGELSGYISFDVGTLHRPVVGKITSIKKLGRLVQAHMLTIALNEDFSVSPKKLSWLPRQS